MKLTDLRVKLNDYGRNKGQYSGRAEFTNSDGDIAIKLTPEMCEKIFMICSDGIIDVAQEAARNMTCNIIEHKAAIEDK